MIKKLIKKIFPAEWIDYLSYKKACFNQKRYKRIAKKDYPKFLKKIYKKKTGLELNLDNPQRYSEKIQWSKINEPVELKTQLTDKVLVREWIKEKIGEKYLIRLVGKGVYSNANEIDFDSLPDKCVIQCNHGSSMIIIYEKGKTNINRTRKKLNYWLKINYAYSSGFELQYRDIKPLILITEFIESRNNELEDYKFLCFNGEPKYCWVDTGRFKNHKRTVFNLKWEKQNFKFSYYDSDETVVKPMNFDKMIEIAKILSSGFNQVRVDLYNVNGQIYFGEMTFTNSSGYEKITPVEMDYELGKYYIIN